MDLKTILSGNQNTNKDLYWSMVLEPDWVQAGIWYIDEQSAHVISVSPPVAWKTDEEIINSSDAALSAAIQKLPENAGEPVNTVFGVPSSWVGDGQIKEEYLSKIKVLCTKLSLQPVGFVVLAEAISHFVKSQEGSPLNAVVIGVGTENIEVSLFKTGVHVGSFQVARSISVIDDVVEGLTRFSETEALPSRFILFDGKEGELEEVRQAIHSASWERYEKIKFLHTPKVEIVGPEKKVLAVSLAGGAEIAKVAKVTSFDLGEEEKAMKEELGKEHENVAAVDAEKLGFVVGKDIASQETIQSFQHPSPVQEQKGLTPSEPHRAENSSYQGNTPLKGIVPSIMHLFYSVLGKFRTIIPAKKPGFERTTNVNNLLIAGIVGLVAFFIFGFIFWWYYPKATVVVYVSPKKLEESATIYVDPKVKGVNIEKSVIPGEIKSQKESGDKTKSTSGTKTVGDKAKGEVKLYRSGAELKLDSGTVLAGPGGYKFTLDGEVTIASGSASTPGVSKVNVTADKIGSEYNLAASSSFSVGNYPSSDIEAKNENAFSGGSSREITAVSQEDQDSLEKDLIEELTDNGRDDISKGLSDDKYLVKESAITKELERTFGAKVGDEASTLKLNLSVDVSAIVVSKTDLMSYAKDILKDKISSGFVLREDQISPTFEYIDEKDGVYELKATFKVNLLPEAKPEDIINKIAGKYPPLAKDYLSSIDGFSRAEVNIKPKFPGRLGIIPKVKKNISVEISAER